jgi:hypothetical protein
MHKQLARGTPAEHGRCDHGSMQESNQDQHECDLNNLE